MIKPFEAYENARKAFIVSSTVRRNTLMALIAVTALGYSAALLLARHIEGQNQFERLIAMAEHPDAIDLLTVGLPQGIRKIDERRYLISRNTTVNVIMAEVDVSCSFAVLRAVNEEGKLLERQWDYRYVRTGDLGRYWLVTSLAVNMGFVSEYTIELLGSPACVNVKRWLLVPVKDAGSWPYLLYNDSFKLDQGTALPLLSNGYKTMPTDSDSLALPN
jgi:hypothetical protein